jgi:hypothetical protein
LWYEWRICCASTAATNNCSTTIVLQEKIFIVATQVMVPFPFV